MGNININKLNPHPKNDFYFTDIIGDKYEEVKNSIHTKGMRDPIRITTSYTVFSGHQRLRVAIDLGWTEVPVEIIDIDEWEAEYRLIAENSERRGESETDPVKKGRQAAFLKEYWGVKNGGNKAEGPMVLLKDVADAIGENERSTKRLIKLNDLIPEIQSLVSLNKLSVRAAEQLAFLTEEEQRAIFNNDQESIENLTVNESKELRNEIEGLRDKNKSLMDTIESLKNKPAEVIHREVVKEVVPDNVKKELDKYKNLKSKIKDIEEERDRYISQARELESKISESHNDNSNLSPSTKLFLKKRGKIQDLAYELISDIKFLSISPATDLNEMYTVDAIKLFDELLVAVQEAKGSFANKNKNNYVDAHYEIVE